MGRTLGGELSDRNLGTEGVSSLLLCGGLSTQDVGAFDHETSDLGQSTDQASKQRVSVGRAPM